MKITSDFPGGNIKLLSEQTENGKTVVTLEQDLRDTDIWWFYWCFRIDDPPVGEVEFRFVNKGVVCPNGPCTSVDGNNWCFDKSSRVDECCFRFNFTGEKSRYFSFSIPYVIKDFESFYETIKNDKTLKRSVFTVSEKGRELPLLTMGNGSRDIFFTARHHCCESTASYVLDSVVRSILVSYRDMLDRFTFHIIPFTDIDGAEQGDQGKNRIPHDHNRDYTDKPIYNVTRAIYEYTDGRDIAAFIDFHSPWCWGGANDEPHIHMGPEAEPTPMLQYELAEHIKELTAKDARDVIRFNGVITRYGDKANLVGTESSKNFYKLKRNANIAFTIETPYSGNLAYGYTKGQLYIFGEHIAQALYETLMK